MWYTVHRWSLSFQTSRLFNNNSCVCRNIFDVPGRDERVLALEKISTGPRFWDDPKQAGTVMKELEALKKDRTDLDSLNRRARDLLELATPGGSEEESVILTEEMASLKEAVDGWELRTYLSGPYDRSDALLTIRSGAGGVDAQDFAEMLLRMYLRYGERRGFRSKVIDEARGGEAGIKSATIELSGEFVYGYLKHEAGIHRLVRLSPFNANNLRQTSFASVEVLPVVEDNTAVEIRTEDLRIDTFRSSGAGGQHVNKTESAIRITHLPTNIVVSCQSERSQLQNREEAMKILRGKLAQQKLEEQEAARLKLRGEAKSAEWGNQIRSYVLHPYTLVKDHRSNIETSSATAVLDGDLDHFIEQNLRTLKRP
jgi:peptide chain release factor 2